jgi:hypothetical protein
LAASKKKAARLAAEMQDTKLHLEEQMTRNNELENQLMGLKTSTV